MAEVTDRELARLLVRRWGRGWDEELSATDVAALLQGVSVSTVNKWRVEGRGPKYSKSGYWVRYRTADVALWVVRQWTGGEGE